MIVVVLAAKAAIAVLLLASGGAKLADIGGFAAAIKLFVPARAVVRVPSALPVAAITIASAELIAGAISLCWPTAGWMNPAVLVLGCGFAVVAGVGYARHRGRRCHCFGALTRRGFSTRTLLRALAIVAAAALACQRIHPTAQLRLGTEMHVLLLAAAALLAAVACTAARALAKTATSGMVA
jgi:hypothetical protein